MEASSPLTLQRWSGNLSFCGLHRHSVAVTLPRSTVVSDPAPHGFTLPSLSVGSKRNGTGKQSSLCRVLASSSSSSSSSNYNGTPQSFDYDVIIIGAGVGGHGAALHAVEKVGVFLQWKILKGGFFVVGKFESYLCFTTLFLGNLFLHEFVLKCSFPS